MSKSESDYLAQRFGYGPAGAEEEFASSESALATLMREKRQGDGLEKELAHRLREESRLKTLYRGKKSLSRVERMVFRRNLGKWRTDIYLNDAHRRVVTAIDAQSALFDRLVCFWSNHFTVSIRKGEVQVTAGLFEDMAIRRHVLGRFEDMLLAAEFHPAMMTYLDLPQSMGPHSPAGRHRSKGLNENLAREILELHTLGADGGYSQADVTEFAKIMTGWTIDYGGGVVAFEPRQAEPGSKRFLGEDYGGRQPVRDDYERALHRLAVHPATARHIARKMVLHFFGDQAGEGAVESIAEVFRDTGGDLPSVYRVLLELPQATARTGDKARTDFEFVVAALRAARIKASTVSPLVKELRLKPNPLSVGAFARMQQQLWRAESPKGWPERPEDWLGPSALAERLQFISRLVPKIRAGDAGDFLQQALGNIASPQTRHVVSIASTREEAIALALASPEFNRR